MVFKYVIVQKMVGFMVSVYGVLFSLSMLLAGCSQSQDEEMEEVGKIVLMEEEEDAASWEPAQSQMIAEGEDLGQEFSFSEDLQTE